MKKLAYISGPYRSETINGIYENIQLARARGVEVLLFGEYYPVIPHLSSCFMDGLVSDEEFLESTLELMKRCDAIFLVKGWEKSEGSRIKMKCALQRKMAIFDENNIPIVRLL